MKRDENPFEKMQINPTFARYFNLRMVRIIPSCLTVSFHVISYFMPL